MLKRFWQLNCWLLLLPVSIAWVAISSVASARSLGPEIEIATNVYLVPDEKAESVSAWMIVGAGCADEEGGECKGIAHHLEHLHLIGRGPDHRKSAIGLFAGGTGNGWTNHKTTTFYQRFAVTPTDKEARLDSVFAYFAKTLQGFDVSADAALRERDIVMDEYRRGTGATALGRFIAELRTKVLPGDPLGQRVIGTPESIAAFTAERAKAFHDRWYKLENVKLVIHGPVRQLDVEAAYGRHLKPLGTGGKVMRANDAARTFPPVSETFEVLDPTVQLETINIERVVPYDNYDNGRLNYARNLVGQFFVSSLPGSPTDVLYRQKNLIGAGNFAISRPHSGQLWLSFSVNPAENVGREKIVLAVETYLSDLAVRGLDAGTIARLKQRTFGEYDGLGKDPARYAQSMVAYFGGRESHAGWVSRHANLEAVTEEDVHHILRALAAPGRQVVGNLRNPGAVAPQPTVNSSPQASLPSAPPATAPVPAASASVQAVADPLPAKTGSAIGFSYAKARTSKGLEFYYRHDPEAPQAALSFGWPHANGAVPGAEGAVQMTPNVLFAANDGTAKGALTERLKDLQATCSLNAGPVVVSGACAAPTATFTQALKHFAEVFDAPVSEPVFRKLEAQLKRSVEQSLTQPTVIGELALQQMLLDADHPYRRALSPKRFEGMAPAQIVVFQREVFKRDGLVIAASGALNEAAFAEAIDTAFARLPSKGQSTSRAWPRPRVVGKTFVVKAETKQTIVSVAALTSVEIGLPSLMGYVAVNVLGGGADARLHQKIRSDLGATYNIVARLTQVYPGTFTLSLSTSVDPEKAPAALAAIREVYDRWQKGDMTGNELDAVRKRFLTDLANQLRSPAQINGRLMVSYLLSGLSAEHTATYEARLNGIKPAELNAYVRSHIPPVSDLSVVVVTSKPEGIVADCMVAALADLASCR